QVGFDQQPGTMANRGYRLSGAIEVPDQLDRRSVASQRVRVAYAARKNQRIIVFGPRVGDAKVRPNGLPRVVSDRRLDRRQGGRGKVNLGTLPGQDLARAEQLPFLEAVGRPDQNSGACQSRQQPFSRSAGTALPL